MKRDKIYNEYMFDTKVENIFINEYMKDAPADFLKVYLMALMFTDLGKEMDEEKLKKSDADKNPRRLFLSKPSYSP